VVDLTEECIQACKHRFAECFHIDYHVNDGRSLDMIADSSVDFVFSFDSLVHVDESIMKSYLSQLQRIMNKDGVAFIHHSNLGEYHTRYSRIRSIPIPRLEGVLARVGILENLHWRDLSVDAKKVEGLAEEHGLRCISQEITNWGTTNMLIDCMSTMVKSNSSLVRTNRVLRNAKFMQEAQNLSQLAQLYSPSTSLEK
jgi:hypothetical protein